MNTEKQLYTISVYTENNIGLLNRISAIFQRRHINIESLNISPSEIEGVAKFTIVVNMTLAMDDARRFDSIILRLTGVRSFLFISYGVLRTLMLLS